MADPFPTEDEAFAYLEEQYGEPLNEARRLAISNNLSTFFSILNEWDLKQKARGEEEPDELETDRYQKESVHAKTNQNKKPASK